MNTLRTDPQSFLFSLPASRAPAPAKHESDDAFSQILDKHLSKNDSPGSRDAVSARDASEPARSRPGSRTHDDASARDTAETRGRSRHGPNPRRDDKAPSAKPADKPSAKSSAARHDDASAAKKPDPKPSGRKAESADSATGDHPQKASDKAKSDVAQQASDADAGVAGQPTTADGKTENAAPADGKSSPDGNPDGQPQSDNSGDNSAAKSQAGDGTATAGANPAAIPVPGQGIPVEIAILKLTGRSTAPMAGGKPLPAGLPAALVAAAGQNNVLQALAALTDAESASSQTADMIAGGLKFGLVIPNGRGTPGQSGAASSGPDGFPGDDAGNDAAGTTQGMDPVNTAISMAAKGKSLPDPNASQAGADKSRNTAGQSPVALPVAPDQNGKTPAFALAFPGNRPNAAVSTARLDNDIAASVTVGGGDAAYQEAEISAFSQYLGPNAASSLAQANAMRQSSFMAELKQSLQALPPHEQIAVQIQNAMQNGSSRMTVDLQPAELGRVEIKLDVDKDKKVSATIVADRPATLDLLQRDAKALERALQQAGLQADSGSLSFSLRDTGGQSGGQGQGGNGRAGGKGSDKGVGMAMGVEPAKSDVVAIANGYVDLET
jgi:flagellar hook-length control protein FliK